ncbi:MAG: prolipoprotein diacylglyceryl transferase family protein, partial [Planctomycetota bacterium]
ISAYLPFEAGWPLVPWSEVIYASAYLAVPLAFLVAPTSTDLRELCAAALWATGLIGLLWWTLPFVAEPRALDGLEPSFFVDLLALERAYDDPVGLGAMPSFHVTWAFLAASVMRHPHRGRLGERSLAGLLPWGWAILVGISCVTTGMHAAVDVVAGALVFLFVSQRRAVWRAIRAASERLANAWVEWRVGPVRIINHGFFGGLAALAGALVILGVLGDGSAVDLWVLGLSSIVTAGLWAQIVEGESVSLRPFGYYGAVVGLVLGGGVLFLMGRDPMAPWAAFGVASPWIQGIGRCRCLVQGCCHGQPCPEPMGIRVTHPRSRVVKVAALVGQPIYPTQTYSILWNVAAGLVLFRLWSVAVPAPVLVGAYLMLAGVGRFVEESYRGEPQTPRVLGLPIYQWNATISFVAGILFTAWPGDPLPASNGLSSVDAVHALGLSLVVTCLMGVDFPESTRRFGRLTK